MKILQTAIPQNQIFSHFNKGQAMRRSKRTRSKTHVSAQISIVPEKLMPYYRHHLRSIPDLIVLSYMTNDEVEQLLPESVSEKLNEERDDLPITMSFGRHFIVLNFRRRKRVLDLDLDRAYRDLQQ